MKKAQPIIEDKQEWEKRMLALPIKDFIEVFSNAAKEQIEITGKKMTKTTMLRFALSGVIKLSIPMRLKCEEALRHMRKKVYIDDAEEIRELRLQVRRLERKGIGLPAQMRNELPVQASCCDGKVRVSIDGKVEINGKHCRDFQPQMGKILYAFAIYDQEGYVGYEHLGQIALGMRGSPLPRTQQRLRTRLSRTRQVLNRHLPGWDFVSYGEGKWNLERVEEAVM